jgi:hypothetical protein
MQTRSQVMYPSPPPRLGVSRSSALAERRAARRGGVRGVAAPPSAGCVGHGCGAERWRPEDAA